MVRTLQVRFVKTAMTAITVLLLVVILAISGINTYRIYADVKALEDMLLDNRGLPDMGMTNPGGPGRRNRRITPDRAMSARYFLVQLSEDGTVEKTDTSRIYSVSEEEAQEMAQTVIRSGKESGLTERFLYQTREVDDGTTVVFMDVSSQISSVLSVIVISFVIAGIGWALMLLLVIALSKKAITPIAENIVRQKQFVTNAGHETRNIKAQTQRLNVLMQNLLTLSRMDEPDLKLPMEDFDLGDLLRESAAPFEEPAREKKIQFTVDAAPVTIHANRDSMGQLLGILFDNAVKYTPEGGIITAAIRTENRQVVLEQKNSIDPASAVEEPGRLFERFYRSDSARDRKKGGYGIGLSAARAIAQANGAEISAMYPDQETIVFNVRKMV